MKKQVKVSFNLTVEVDDNATDEQIIDETLRELDYLAGSNDGSEVLANIERKNISIDDQRKSYVILDELNRWVATGKNETPEEIQDTITSLRERMAEDNESDLDLLFFETVGKSIHV